ncbi:MAG: hypothetical protein J0L85_02530, partial [Zoogloea sp.]|nr:hypothetical protein [Zoogloea sp.]
SFWYKARKPYQTPLRTEYPHLSVVHLFKELLHQQRRGAHYTELQNPVKQFVFRESTPKNKHLKRRPRKTSSRTPLHRSSATFPFALQRRGAHSTELSNPVKRLFLADTAENNPLNADSGFNPKPPSPPQRYVSVCAAAKDANYIELSDYVKKIGKINLLSLCTPGSEHYPRFGLTHWPDRL